MFEKHSIDLLNKALDRLEIGFHLPATSDRLDSTKWLEVIEKVADNMQDNYPYFHPLFAGQMLKPPHPVAKAAYMLAMWINPNNHAMDGGRASSKMEKEAISELAQMIGYVHHLGHLTGGGTMANLEGLWIAGKETGNRLIVASDQSHYTHERICSVLHLPFKKIRTDARGKMDLGHLESVLKQENVGTVVVTIGTTGLGAVDPLKKILALKEKYEFRIHVDAAYGGYFKLAENLPSSVNQDYDLLGQSDSLVIDPHKHGLQPYGCGCILFRNPEVAKHYLHDSPYTYFTSDELHLGEISLECSRAGASAVGLWATQQLLPLKKGGAFANDLEKSRKAAISLAQKVSESNFFELIVPPETDIVVFAAKAASTSLMSQNALDIFKNAEKHHLYLSLFKFPTDKLTLGNIKVDTEYVTCLRSCLMKPEHLKWIDEIWSRLVASLQSPGR